MLYSKHFLLFVLSLLWVQSSSYAQETKLEINAEVDIATQQIRISQNIIFKNTSQSTLKTIYLNDWNHSYSSKNTPLAKRFTDEFSTKFLFAKEKEFGFTKIFNISQNDENLEFKRLKKHPDIIEVTLNKPIIPGDSYHLNLHYILKLPNSNFTGYGITNTNNLQLKYWYITPTMYTTEWQFYSNKNLDDLYVPKSDIVLQMTFPLNYKAITALDYLNRTATKNNQTVLYQGKDRVNTEFFLSTIPTYETLQTDVLTIVSDLNEKGLNTTEKAILTDRVTQFITKNLGAYPHKTLVISSLDDRKNPIYGLNQLPDFIRPFPNNFQYELRLTKAAINSYLESVLLLNPRKDYWLKDALQVYYLMKYVDVHYPDMKLLGSLAKIWGVRSFHAADLNFNEQYGLAYMHMARTNRDQPITMQKDSLLKFNKNIANKYKAGIGLKYLDDFINSDITENGIKEFINNNKLQHIHSADFEAFMKSKTPKNIDWFFKDYLSSRKKIDFKIKDITQTKDSVTITIKNKRQNTMPISLFRLDNDSVLSKQWIENIKGSKRITIPKGSANKLVLNYDNTIPEFNSRDNWKSLKGFFFNNKPLQFRVFKDIEDPNFNQVFLMPLVQFNNIYDGLTLGAKIYNKTLLRKAFSYNFSPEYGTRSKSLTGSTSVSNTHFLENNNLNQVSYGLRAVYRSFGEDLFFRSITPSIGFSFRDHKDLRSNKSQKLVVRYVGIDRDEDLNSINEEEAPNYSVLNISYANSNNNLTNVSRWFTDLQIANKFSKVSFNYQYRYLFNSNQQLSLRFYAGAFLKNKTAVESDYFSFALDRPTDYLFDYNYLGRSEASGLFSQELIIAEGGFKSKLQTPFANQWITTANVSTSIWRWFQVYGDIGFVKNKFKNPEFVYDAGMRLNLVQDYFEIYFPFYSNLGWEIAEPNYAERIRFIFTVDPKSLLGLFRRKWY